MRNSESMKELHFVHSIIEISFTLFVIVLHMLNARMAYVNIQHAVQRLERFDPNTDRNLRPVRTWMWLLVVVGVIHVVICVAFFLVFNVYLHLGWTVLSNQTCILSMNTLSGLYASLMMTTIVKIKDDQQQVDIASVFTGV